MKFKASLIILVLFQMTLVSKARPDYYYDYSEEDYYEELGEGEEFGGENICQLPKELGYSGNYHLLLCEDFEE